MRCLDAATGEEVWKIQGWFGGMSPTSSNILMADGILVGLNFFDNQLYAFGRGPSATTVSAYTDVSVLGSKVVIKGTVTDQSSSGRRDMNGVLEFSLKGSPAISDEDMAAWMEYKFMQQAMPANVKGVEVTLHANDPNGNQVPLGTAVSDMNGNFGLSFVPEVPGEYQIIATFAGSKAYGPSYSSTYLTIEDAPDATQSPIQQQTADNTMTIIAAAIAIIIAVAIVGAILLLAIKKRP